MRWKGFFRELKSLEYAYWEFASQTVSENSIGFAWEHV
jgi:hypothetical protein